jgi:translation initiation factor IF-1
MRNDRFRVPTGDKVQVEMTPHDLTEDRNTDRPE